LFGKKTKPHETVFVDVLAHDPWWVRWPLMFWKLHKVQLTFSGTRGFGRRYDGVMLFVASDRNGGKLAERDIMELANLVSNFVREKGYKEVRGYTHFESISVASDQTF
jgi:hypothetical protein